MAQTVPPAEGAVLLNPPPHLLGRHNAILWGRGKRHHVAGFEGPLSIKAVVRGSATWETASGRYVVDRGSYLILDEGQPYSITVESSEPVETFCVFFQRGLVGDVARALVASEDALLDLPDRMAPRAWEIFETVRPHDHRVSPKLGRLRRTLAEDGAGTLELDEAIHVLAAGLSALQADVRQEAARVPAVRASTQAEVYRRLRRARDFMEGHLEESLTLGRVAREACLSSFHFHRSFRRAFGETPGSYVTRRRLERARDLLVQTDRPVTDVCLDVGFESLGSFSALFHRRFGLPPRQLRARGETPAAPWRAC